MEATHKYLVKSRSSRVESRVRDVGVFDESTRRLPSNFAGERERDFVFRKSRWRVLQVRSDLISVQPIR